MTAADHPVELVVFELGQQRFAAPAAEIARIERAGDGDDADARVLIINREAGGATLRVDAVRDVITVTRDRIRRMPDYIARGARHDWAWGVAVLPNDELVVLIELYRYDGGKELCE